MKRLISLFQKVVPIGFLSIIVLTIILTGCTRKTHSPMKVRIGYEAILSNYAFFVAYENRYFEAEGLQVEAIQFNTTNEQTLALLAGHVDMISNSSMALLLAAEAEKPGRFQVFMANGDLGNKLLVNNDSTFTSIEDLSGATIGTFPGTTMLTYASVSLSPYFDEANFPTLVGMPPPSLADALLTGRVDAIYAIEPIVSVAIQRDDAREILDNPLGNIKTPFTGGASVIRTDFVDENPEASAAMIRAMNKGIDFIRENDVEAREILAKYTGFDSTLLQFSMLGYRWKLNEIDRDAIESLAIILTEFGVVDIRVDTTNWYYNSDK